MPKKKPLPSNRFLNPLKYCKGCTYAREKHCVAGRCHKAISERARKHNAKLDW